MKRNRPRIVLDARPLSHPHFGGFRTYVRSLVRGLRERIEAGQDDIELILYLDRPLPAEIAKTLPPGCETRILHPNRIRSDFLLFPQQIRQDAPDLVHGTANYLPLRLSAPTTLTIHDAMGIKKYPWNNRVSRTLRQRGIDFYWSVLTRLSARAARRIVTDSHGAAKELAGALGFPSKRFAVVHPGLSLPLSCNDKQRDSHTILAIASPDLRKNLDCLYRTLTEEKSRFPAKLPKLVVVCSNDRAAEHAEVRLKAMGISDYCLLRKPDDQTLADAYARATVFVWPSYLEGFGLPPLEAMGAGCPVVSSSAPVMPEILRDVPLYFDPNHPAELAQQLATLLADSVMRREHGERGKAHAESFTCHTMAKGMVAAWREAIPV